MASLKSSTVTPANVGVQILKNRVWGETRFNFQIDAEPYDLGPGIRRDDRNGEDV